MISKLFLRKPGKSKSLNPDSTGSDGSFNAEAKENVILNIENSDHAKRASSKFYVGVDDEKLLLSSGATESQMDLFHGANHLSCSPVKHCLLFDTVKNDIPQVSDERDKCSTNPAKPVIKPKPKALINISLPSTGTETYVLSGSMNSAPGSPELISSPYPIRVTACVRSSIFPPGSPRKIECSALSIGDLHEENSEPSESRSIASSTMMIVTKQVSSDGQKSSTPAFSSTSCSSPFKRQSNRGSCRQSFTTEDADIGLSSRKSIFHSEFSPPLPSKPKPSILRQIHFASSGVGHMVDTMEVLTTCHRRSRSFSSKNRSAMESLLEQQRVSMKPKPPIKPRNKLDQNCSLEDVPELLDKSQSSNSIDSQYFENSGSSEEIQNLQNMSKASPKPAVPPTKPDMSKFHQNMDKVSEESVEDLSYTCQVGEDCKKTTSETDLCRMSSEKRCSISDDESSAESDFAEDDFSNLVKAKMVGEELFKTEEAYVSRLDLLNEIFHNKIMSRNREEHFIPDEVIAQVFSNIKSIYVFHHDFLLPQLKACVEKWDLGMQCFGEVLKKFAPFLKLYTDYVKNFQNATNLITFWLSRSPVFASCLEDIHRLPVCQNLTLQHHLLEPIQRVPRYELLLRDYIKYLPKDSDDRSHASDALNLVTRAAQHSNTEMRKIEKFQKLMDLKESLGGLADSLKLLSDPTRQLIKEGKITKISARDGDHSERYLILFSDMLLVCQSLPLKLGLRQQYTIKDKLDIRGMKVLEGNNRDTANTFVIKSKQKSIEFCGSSLESKFEWQKALWGAISDYTKKEYSRNADQSLETVFQDDALGKRAPTWIKDQETTMCMLCGEIFSAFKRRHHCRCCGKVVCSKCSSYKMRLDYDADHERRVCARCFSALSLRESAAVDVRGPSRGRKVLQVSATDPSFLSGYLVMSNDKKTWNRMWFTVHSDFALYSYKAHQDVIAHMSVPLPGYEVKALNKSDEVQQRDFVFEVSLERLKKVYYFQADDEAQRKRWIDVLSCAVKAEPPNSTVCSTSTGSVLPLSEGRPDLESVVEQSEKI